MAAETYIVTKGQAQYPFRMPSSHTLPNQAQINSFDAGMPSSGFMAGNGRDPSRGDSDASSAILLRNLPKHTGPEALRTMLLFAKDLVGADLIPNDSPADKGSLSAIARFRTLNAAHEARSLLDGKQNNPNEPPMIVEVLPLTPAGGLGPRRNTFDMASNRGATSSSSSTNSSTGPLGLQSSRYGGTFPGMDRISPANPPTGMPSSGPSSTGELSTPDITSPFQSFFPPQQSPNGPMFNDRQRISGQSLIREDGVDDEPAELLKDPVAYAKSDINGAVGRRNTTNQLPTSRFAGLSLSTNGMASPPNPGFTSPRSVQPMQSPTTAMSPTGMPGTGPNSSYQLSNQHFPQRHNYPPVNPADQNPPCNTLYVGNLPIDTSEDELKAMFSKQRGYKRLCFRTKQNGPMCFVEFEDISFATKALNELYGHPLHNSVKGGIRLSFSKNPLGVRTGQPGGMGSPTPLSPQGPMHGMNGIGNMAPFSTANGPPPGLAAPPGLQSPPLVNGIGNPMQGNVMNSGFGVGGVGVNAFGMNMKGSASGGMVGNAGAQWNGGPLPDYMVGR